MKAKSILWLDDIRNPFLDTEKTVPKEKGIIEWVLSYDEFVMWIDKFGLPDIISFDHDLGDIYESNEFMESYQIGKGYKEKTGMDCAKYLIDYCLDNNKPLPKYYVHSSNPVGKENILSILDNFDKIS